MVDYIRPESNYYYEETATNINTLVRDELIYQYKEELDNYDEELLDAFLRLIQYYSTGAQYREFLRSLNEDNGENEDAV